MPRPSGPGGLRIHSHRRQRATASATGARAGSARPGADQEELPGAQLISSVPPITIVRFGGSRNASPRGVALWTSQMYSRLRQVAIGECPPVRTVRTDAKQRISSGLIPNSGNRSPIAAMARGRSWISLEPERDGQVVEPRVVLGELIDDTFIVADLGHRRGLHANDVDPLVQRTVEPHILLQRQRVAFGLACR